MKSKQEILAQFESDASMSGGSTEAITKAAARAQIEMKHAEVFTLIAINATLEDLVAGIVDLGKRVTRTGNIIDEIGAEMNKEINVQGPALESGRD